MRLNQSVYKVLQDTGRRVKSCPKCSVNAGRRVFWACPGAFGSSGARAGNQVQSWCTKCRNGGCLKRKRRS